MNFERPASKKESGPNLKMEINPDFTDFIPEEFKKDPLAYFDGLGKNIKPGEVEHDEAGKVKEDPTAVKQFPVWRDKAGKELSVIGKKVNAEKSQIGKSGDPFYEYKIMKIVREIGLPCPEPIASIEQAGEFLILMEKIKGINWFEAKDLNLKSKGYTDEDIQNLKKEADEKMQELSRKFEEAGIFRKWKLSDMIFDIDIENKTIKGIVPVDWERTKIDQPKVEGYKRRPRDNK